MTSRARLRAAALLSLACVVAAGCEKIIGADFGGVESVTCGHVRPPGPPQITNAGNSKSFTVAVYSAELGEENDPTGPRFRTIGYDLDGVCTNEAQGPSCAGFAWTNGDQTDGIDGRDNAIGKLTNAQAPTFGQVVLSSATLSDDMLTGKKAPMAVLRISNYSGLADDDQVNVEWFTAAPAVDGAPPPNWDDPTRPVDVTTGSVVAGSSGGDAAVDEAGAPLLVASHVDTQAYVNNYTLAAHIVNGPVMRLANVAFVLTDVRVTAKISTDGQRLEGATMAGWFPMGEMFRRLPQFTNVLVGVSICTDHPYYAKVKRYFCAFTDMLDTGQVDPSAGCSAMSFAVGFETRPVTIGAAVDETTTSPCNASNDPALDSCATAPTGDF